MGVAGLWDILRPAAQTRSLSHIALEDGFNRPPPPSSSPPLRGFRIGIDASIWFFHAAYGREGENPELRTLFFRCCRLMHTPFLPLFVFDGPKRPNMKRGKRIGKEAHWMTGGMKNIIEAFGFEWRTAPGEAEAELAYLNRVGVIDGILSDDVDNFLFGATLVIRNPSPTLTGNSNRPLPTTNHTTTFSLPHPAVNLTRGGLILIGLLSGGDYHKGLDGCGMKVAVGLARCGFGDTLIEAVWKYVKGAAGEEAEEVEGRKELEDWLVGWREDVANELATNSQGHLPSKRAALSRTLLSFNSPSAPSHKDTFPDLRILLYYTTPLTSETYHRSSRNKIEINWTKGEPDLGKIAAVCELYFEWGWEKRIIKRFRTLIWTGAICRILRRAIVEADRKAIAVARSSSCSAPTTPKKNTNANGTRNDSECGTPSKMIAKHFSSLSLTGSPSKQRAFPPSHYDHSRAFSLSSDRSSDQENDSASDEDAGRKRSEPLITKIHSTRTHISTDKILEYRLEIAPAQLVRLVKGGIKGTRVEPEVDDIYADHDGNDDDGFGRDSDDDEGGEVDKEKRTKKAPLHPDTHLRVWMPACMVKLVEPGLVEEYEEVVRMREERKARRGKGRRKKAGESGRGKNSKGKVVAWYDEPSDEELEAKKKDKATKKAKVKGSKAYIDLSESDSMDSDNIRNNLKGYFSVTEPMAIPSTAPVSVSEPSGSPSMSQPKVRSKPPPIPHKPLYDFSGSDSDSPPESVTLTAPIPTITRSKPKIKSSPAIMRISDILSPANSSPRQILSPGPGVEPRPFPMSLEDNYEDDFFDNDFIDNDFDFNFELGNFEDDNVGMNLHMNDDPFHVVEGRQEPPTSPTPTPPKQVRKKIAQSSSDSDGELYGATLKKSPRKSNKHSSPRKHATMPSGQDPDPEDIARPASPSPIRSRAKAPASGLTSKPIPKTIVRKADRPSKIDDTIIDISSGEDAPPCVKFTKPPLLVARSMRTQSYHEKSKVSKSVVKVRAKYALAISDMNSQPPYDDDIIDLT